MTLPEVIRILREVEAEAQEVDSTAAAWVAEARKAIVEEWDRELLDEASERLAIAQEQAWRDNDRERRGEGRPRW